MTTDTWTWTHGQQSEMARRSGVTCSYLCDLLHKRKRASPDVAARIATAAAALGVPLTREDMLYPAESSSPAFHA